MSVQAMAVEGATAEETISFPKSLWHICSQFQHYRIVPVTAASNATLDLQVILAKMTRCQ